MLYPRRTNRPSSTSDALESLALRRRLGCYLIAPSPAAVREACRASDVYIGHAA